MLQKAAGETCGIRLGKRNYCCGISDLSYCAGPDMEELKAYAANAPLFGPVGRDAHQMSERVNARSLLEEVPAILQHFIEQVFANDGGM